MSILLSRVQSSKMMIWFSLFGSVASSITLIFVQEKKAALAVSASFGAAMSNSYATGFLYAER